MKAPKIHRNTKYFNSKINKIEIQKPKFKFPKMENIFLLNKSVHVLLLWIGAKKKNRKHTF